MGSKSSSGRWKELRSLLRRMEPQIIEMFHRYEVPPNAAAEILDEVVLLLLYRWDDVMRPEAWLLEMLEHKTCRSHSPLDEPRRAAKE